MSAHVGTAAVAGAGTRVTSEKVVRSARVQRAEVALIASVCAENGPPVTLSCAHVMDEDRDPALSLIGSQLLQHPLTSRPVRRRRR
jgi:hypothetical protein